MSPFEDEVTDNGSRKTIETSPVRTVLALPSPELPDEPPPNYDEAQAQAITMRFDERAREEADRE